MIVRSVFCRALRAGLFLTSLSIAQWAFDARAEEPEAAALPVKRVVLYNAGVGFFERRADIEGNAKVDLKFNSTEINDLLKSMVLQDLGGGKISTVTYASIDPITKTLKTFAIDLTNNPTMANLLDQVRGEKVEIEAPNRVTGTILGVETREQQVGDKDRVVKTEFLNLLTETGLRSFPMASISRIKLTDAKLDTELRQALNVLALGHATDKKTVSVNFEGEGKRPVRVGYIQQSPIWRTTYRLVLSDKKPPFLQGWALVENTSEEDWQDVNLTLVSGRPISFVMNLYQPLYVNRPVVESELFGSLRPQVYGQNMDANASDFAMAPMFRNGPRADKQLASQGRAGGLVISAPAPAAQAEVESEVVQLNNQLNLSRGIATAAAGADVGELFQYRIESPVSLSPCTAPFQRRRAGRKAIDLQRQRAAEASTQWPAVEEHDRTAPDAGTRHGVRRRHLCRRCTDRGSASRQRAINQLRARPGYRGRARGEIFPRAVDERKNRQGNAYLDAQVRAHPDLHREELGQARQVGAHRISFRCELETDRAQGTHREDA
jgi:hypothetical protein